MTPPTPENAPAILVEIANRQSAVALDEPPMIEAVRRVVSDAGYATAEISVAVVEDAAIRELNRQYLQHDYPTDVLSFVLDPSEDRLEGEIVISAETASQNAAEYGQSSQDEMLLYAIHGALHLVGYEDDSPEAKEAMRAAEKHYLNLNLGDNPP